MGGGTPSLPTAVSAARNVARRTSRGSCARQSLGGCVTTVIATTPAASRRIDRAIHRTHRQEMKFMRGAMMN